jgi:hypothetical protein
MNIETEAIQDEPVASPDPFAHAKRILGKRWPYAAALALVLIALGVVFRHRLNWGDVPTWILAATTLLALLAAAFAGVVAYNVLKIEAGRDLKAAEERKQAHVDRMEAAIERARAEADRDAARLAADVEQAAQREADRRAQARGITSWFAYFPLSLHGTPVRELVPTANHPFTWGGAVRNASELPIFDVRLFYFRVNDPQDGRPWTATQVFASVDIIRVIPPGQTRNEELPDRVRTQYKDCDDQVYVVGIEFTDANGVRWYRDERGALKER